MTKSPIVVWVRSNVRSDTDVPLLSPLSFPSASGENHLRLPSVQWFAGQTEGTQRGLESTTKTLTHGDVLRGFWWLLWSVYSSHANPVVEAVTEYCETVEDLPPPFMYQHISLGLDGDFVYDICGIQVGLSAMSSVGMTPKSGTNSTCSREEDVVAISRAEFENSYSMADSDPGMFRTTIEVLRPTSAWNSMGAISESLTTEGDHIFRQTLIDQGDSQSSELIDQSTVLESLEKSAVNNFQSSGTLFTAHSSTSSPDLEGRSDREEISSQNRHRKSSELIDEEWNGSQTVLQPSMTSDEFRSFSFNSNFFGHLGVGVDRKKKDVSKSTVHVEYSPEENSTDGGGTGGNRSNHLGLINQPTNQIISPSTETGITPVACNPTRFVPNPNSTSLEHDDLRAMKLDGSLSESDHHHHHGRHLTIIDVLEARRSLAHPGGRTAKNVLDRLHLTAKMLSDAQCLCEKPCRCKANHHVAPGLALGSTGMSLAVAVNTPFFEALQVNTNL